MRRCLVELLACPECQGAVEVVESREENTLRILRGTLRCTSCARHYPIDKGVPRLVKAAEDVTARRLYIETMESILKNANKIILDKTTAASGVVPYLPLPGLRQPPSAAAPSEPSSPGSTTPPSRRSQP